MEERQYLLEDRDILEAIKKVGDPTTGAAEGMSMHKLAVLQIEATLRNRKTSHDLDESTKIYSRVLIAFAFAQLIFGGFQFAFDAENSMHPIVGAVYLIAAGALIIYIFANLLKKDDKTSID